MWQSAAVAILITAGLDGHNIIFHYQFSGAIYNSFSNGFIFMKAMNTYVVTKMYIVPEYKGHMFITKHNAPAGSMASYIIQLLVKFLIAIELVQFMN